MVIITGEYSHHNFIAFWTVLRALHFSLRFSPLSSLPAAFNFLMCVWLAKEVGGLRIANAEQQKISGWEKKTQRFRSEALQMLSVQYLPQLPFPLGMLKSVPVRVLWSFFETLGNISFVSRFFSCRSANLTHIVVHSSKLEEENNFFPHKNTPGIGDSCSVLEKGREILKKRDGWNSTHQWFWHFIFSTLLGWWCLLTSECYCPI